MKKRKTATTPIDCQEAVTRFNDFLDNFLKGNDREELLKHMAECRHCLERFEFEQLLKSKVQMLSKAQRDEAFIRRMESLIASLE